MKKFKISQIQFQAKATPDQNAELLSKLFKKTQKYKNYNNNKGEAAINVPGRPGPGATKRGSQQNQKPRIPSLFNLPIGCLKNPEKPQTLKKHHIKSPDDPQTNQSPALILASGPPALILRR